MVFIHILYMYHDGFKKFTSSLCSWHIHETNVAQRLSNICPPMMLRKSQKCVCALRALCQRTREHSSVSAAALLAGRPQRGGSVVSLSVDEHSRWGHCESWGAVQHPTALRSSFPQPQSVGQKCILSPVLTEPSGGIRVVVRGLVGESGVGLDGEAEANRRESIQRCAEGEVQNERKGERHADAEEMTMAARQKWDQLCGRWSFTAVWNVVTELCLHSLTFYFATSKTPLLYTVQTQSADSVSVAVSLLLYPEWTFQWYIGVGFQELMIRLTLQPCRE